jgi:dienelactone hydrolase
MALRTISTALFGFAGRTPPPPHRSRGTPTPGHAAGTLISAVPTLSDPTQTWGFTPELHRRPQVAVLSVRPASRGRLRQSLQERPRVQLILTKPTTRALPGRAHARAINAMIPDVMKRLPIDEKRIYAGGFSGGGVLAWTVGLKGNYLAGVISIGSRPAPEHLALSPKFALFAAAGETDFNFQATRELDRIAAKAGAPHRLELFPGPHAWCPPAMARQAVAWLEVLAMRDGRRPRDAARIEALNAEQMAAAEVLAGTGDALAAAGGSRRSPRRSRGLAPLRRSNGRPCAPEACSRQGKRRPR